MINFNGNIQRDYSHSLVNNRGFLYGDALFDTILFRKDELVYSKAHYNRLISSMGQLHMEIPNFFTLFFTQEFWEDEVFKTLQINSNKKARVRTSIFRDSKGFFTPISNSIQFIIQTNELDYQSSTSYTIGLYTDNYLSMSSISNIKTTNRLTNVLASIYTKQKKYNNCILLNNNKHIAEATNANIFLVFGNKIITPKLSEACINGIIRKKLIEIINKSAEFQILEEKISIDELQKADEVFLTNSIIEIQAVSSYKKKVYNSVVSKKLLNLLV